VRRERFQPTPTVLTIPMDGLARTFLAILSLTTRSTDCLFELKPPLARHWINSNDRLGSTTPILLTLFRKTCNSSGIPVAGCCVTKSRN